MKTIKGPAIFLAQFAGDQAPFNSLAGIAQWAADLGYLGVQIPSWDARLFDLEKAAESDAYCDEIKGTLAGRRRRADRALDPPPGPAGRGPPGLRRVASTPSRRRQVRGNPKARQEWAVEQMKLAAKASQAPRPRQPRHLLGRARLALSLSLAAAAGGPDRDRVRRARPALEADPRCVRRGRRRRLLRAPSGRGPDRRRDLRDVPRAGRQPSALPHQLRPEPLPAAAARLPRLHRRLPRADQGVPRQGRRVQPEPEAGRLLGLPALARARRAVPLAGRRPGRLRRHLLASSPPTTTTAGRCWSGSAA